MHEYAITENIVSLVLEEAKRSGVSKVAAINLVVGELSSVIPECIELYFDPLSKGTILEGTKLRFISIDAQLKCNSCGKIFLKKENGIECPGCGGIGTFTENGKEFYIESIEVE